MSIDFAAIMPFVHHAGITIASATREEVKAPSPGARRCAPQPA